jgi:hypothetical protein
LTPGVNRGELLQLWQEFDIFEKYKMLFIMEKSQKNGNGLENFKFLPFHPPEVNGGELSQQWR